MVWFVGDEINKERDKKVAHLCGSDHGTIIVGTVESDISRSLGKLPFLAIQNKA
jgi:hypothetical protein